MARIQTNSFNRVYTSNVGGWSVNNTNLLWNNYWLNSFRYLQIKMAINVITLLFLSFEYSLVLVLLGSIVILGVELFHNGKLENSGEYSTEDSSNEKNGNIKSDEKQFECFTLDSIHAVWLYFEQAPIELWFWSDFDWTYF